MTDLATRIADARKKADEAERLMKTEPFGPDVTWPAALLAFNRAISPSLFIEMADEIARLTASLDATKAQLEKAREALSPFADEHRYWTEVVGCSQVPREELVGLAKVEEKHLRTAARVHAEIIVQSQP